LHKEQTQNYFIKIQKMYVFRQWIYMLTFSLILDVQTEGMIVKILINNIMDSNRWVYIHKS